MRAFLIGVASIIGLLMILAAIAWEIGDEHCRTYPFDVGCRRP